jgi:hypothetical protein
MGLYRDQHRLAGVYHESFVSSQAATTFSVGAQSSVWHRAASRNRRGVSYSIFADLVKLTKTVGQKPAYIISNRRR